MATTHHPAAPGASVLDALSLAAAAADDVLVATVRDTHRAVADRVHGVVRRGVGPAVVPAESLHRGIAAATYGAIGLACRGASRGLDLVAATGRGPRLDDDPRGRFVAAAVNGLIGDELLRDRPQLAIPMAVRSQHRDVPPTPAAVAAAFPAATGRVVVFLHGLCESETAWRLHRDRTGTTYAEALAGLGWTPVLLRANTGLAVRENGAALASLLDDLVAAWPVPVERIALVGHSMGGLVIRAATAIVGDADGGALRWRDLVSDVVTLGTPHRGAVLAAAAEHGSRGLGLLAESAAFGRILDRRSPGIRDLVRGLGPEVPPLPGVRHHLVAATLTGSGRHPVGSLVGDVLVRPDSAFGRGRRGGDLFPGADLLHVGRTDHFGLLNHPEVLDALERWLGAAPDVRMRS